MTTDPQRKSNHGEDYSSARRRADDERRRADDERRRADVERRRADEGRRRADEERHCVAAGKKPMPEDAAEILKSPVFLQGMQAAILEALKVAQSPLKDPAKSLTGHKSDALSRTPPMDNGRGSKRRREPSPEPSLHHLSKDEEVESRRREPSRASAHSRLGPRGRTVHASLNRGRITHQIPPPPPRGQSTYRGAQNDSEELEALKS